MPDLKDGESVEIQGSAAKPYIIKNVGGVYSCSCPAWRNQSRGIEQRTCKHLIQYLGERAEEQRLGGSMPAPSGPASTKPKAVAPALLLAETWTPDAEVTGWWLSELCGAPHNSLYVAVSIMWRNFFPPMASRLLSLSSAT